MSIRSRWLPILLSGALVVAMVALADAFACQELLFPETTAILCGAWIQPRQAWEVDRPRMFLLMAAGAVFGLVANLGLGAVPLPARVLLGYAFCALMMTLMHASMAPMFSAAILPMLLGTDSWAYPAAVVILVTIVCAGQMGLERAGLREPIELPKVETSPSARDALAYWGRRLAVFALVAVPAYVAGLTFLAVPPLIVAYTELSQPGFSLRAHPLRAWAVLAGAGAIGALARNAVALLGLPLAAAAALGFVALVFLWDGLHVWMPPAGAAMLLALLVPWANPWAYALEVACGAAIWVAAALLAFPHNNA